MEFCPLLTPPAPTPSTMRQYSSCRKMSAPPTLPSNVRRALPAAPMHAQQEHGVLQRTAGVFWACNKQECLSSVLDYRTTHFFTCFSQLEVGNPKVDRKGPASVPLRQHPMFFLEASSRSRPISSMDTP